jgi:choline dehydrogenase-like flavoprotein
MTHDYIRHGTTTLFAALNVFEGTVIGQCMARHRHQEFIRFLNRIEAAVPAGKLIHAILDNYAVHKHPKVRAWLARHPRWAFHFTPTSCSWANAVEGFFATLTRRRLQRGAFRSLVDLQAAINRYLGEHNRKPKPFVWTADPDRIIEKVNRGHQAIASNHYLTWAILKAHTQNRAGEVRLRSADPRDVPLIDFHYFEEGSDATGEDLDSVVAGIRFVRRLTKEIKDRGLIAAKEQPGDALQSDDELRDFVRTRAWGHHASCTCTIGPQDSGGVIGSDFRVHGATGLRVVDASVFPRIPGFFIASAVYMIAEKAANVILAA